MKKIEELYAYAKNEKINIENYIDKDKIINGLCLYDKSNCTIYLNKSITNENEEKCVLAEEIGHYKTGIIPTMLSDTSYQTMIIRSINEFRAKKWAIGNLIPFEDFKALLLAKYSKFDIADKLDVTEELVEWAYFVYEPLLYS